MTGRERWHLAVGGRAVAFAALVWERLPELVRQEAEGWWRDPSLASRLLADAAAVAGADAMIVAPAADAVASLAGAGRSGVAAFDLLSDSREAQAADELIEVFRASTSLAALAAVPDEARLVRGLGAGEAGAEDAASDAVMDLARGAMEAGADGLVVVGDDEDEVRSSGRRLRGLAAYYGRPMLGMCGVLAWPETEGLQVAVVSGDGSWPGLEAGIVVTPGDVSGVWDAERLHAVRR